MTDKIQTANNLRFAILSQLGDKGVELIRDFEQAIAEERQERQLNHPYVFTDRRAKAIAAAHQRLDILSAHVHTAENIDTHVASLKEAMTAKDAAYALPDHEYDCVLCHKTFVSPARMVMVVNGYVDHDAEGNVTATRTFQGSAHLVFCPDCKCLIRWD